MYFIQCLSSVATWESVALKVVGCRFSLQPGHTKDSKKMEPNAFWLGSQYSELGLEEFDHLMIPGSGIASAHRSLKD